MTAGMAASKPMAVATKASAMPGATIASVACFTWPKPMKAFRMPHTVPNKPTYGLVEPMVASNTHPLRFPVLEAPFLQHLWLTQPPKTSSKSMKMARRTLGSPS